MSSEQDNQNNQIEKTRYKKLPSERGIRKDLKTGTYQATKSIQGKRFFKNFETLREAKHWRNIFVPSSDASPEVEEKAVLTFGEVWEKYCQSGLVTLSFSTQETRLGQAKFFKGMESIPMNKITPQVISKHILSKKEESIKYSDGRRCNFDNELRILKTVLNWYREEIDFTFVNPVLKKHKLLGRIKETTVRAKKMEPHELLLFFEALKAKPFWYDFAMVQLAFAARVQEIAGLQKHNIDFDKNLLTIKDVAIWSRSSRKFIKLKSLPKNGEIRICFMTSRVRDILERRIADKPESCSHVFHIHGEPVSYREVQHHYNHALAKCGLIKKYSGTHFLRHTMATLTRHVTGSLESVQAVTGHRDQRLVQHYASLDSGLQRNALEQVELFLLEEGRSEKGYEEGRKEGAEGTSCGQNAVKANLG